ncbi:MAG: methyltransferase [Actinobacteria bacterium]|nr:methyltransferase [Actinomycetota bacterium]
MNSRQRIKYAIMHKEADRVPIDLGSAPCTGIATIAYNNLKKYLGVTNNLAKMYDVRQAMAYPEKEIMDMFHIDAIDSGQAFLKSEDDWREWILNDSSKCLIPKNLNIEVDGEGNVPLKDKDNLTLGIKPKNSLYIDQAYWVYKDLPKIPEVIKDEDLVKNSWSIPGPPWHLNVFEENDFEIFIKGHKELYETGDYAVILNIGCNLFEMAQWIRGTENFLMDIYLDRNGIERLVEKLFERNLILLERVLKGIGKYIDVMMLADDLGSQDGLIISPATFREIFKPRYKKYYEFIHKNTEAKIFLHSCGSIYDVLPDLIEIGLDIINPVQTTAKNMEPEKLKNEFGRDITFWGGGCNTRDILPHKTPKEVRDDVKRRIEIFAKDGGFVFNPIHNIMADVPPENIVAMFEAAYEYGKY